MSSFIPTINLHGSLPNINTSKQSFQAKNGEILQKNKTQTWGAYFRRVERTVSSIAIPLIIIGSLTILPAANADKLSDCLDNCDRISDNLAAKGICITLCGLLSLFG